VDNRIYKRKIELTERQAMISAHDAVAELRASEKFLSWKSTPRDRFKSSKIGTDTGGILRTYQTQMAEKHYSPQELADLWGVSVQTIREIFKAEEGVLKIGSDGTRNRRGYKTLRIPQSVAARVHTRLSA
jgi:hypothetical protein